MKQINQSKRFSAIVYISVFVLLFTYNYLTLFICDDFVYQFSFADGTRISSVADIFKSMAAHAHKMNGRLVAHWLVQFFTLLPRWFFDIVNALMFVSWIVLPYKMSVGEKRNNLSLIGIFSAAWLYTPGFHDVVLWQDGACNYLWSVVFGLLFMYPFVKDFMFHKPIKTTVGQMIFLGFSALFGAYSENISFACIFMAMCIVALKLFYRKEKINAYAVAAIILACIGYLTIYLAPAQWANKSVEGNIVALLTSFVNAVIMYRAFSALCIAFVILLILSIKEKADTDSILLALVFLTGSLAANFIMTFAKVYPERSATGTFVFLLVADAILMGTLIQNVKYKTALICVLAVTILAAITALAEATRDIGKTYIEMSGNEAHIYECKEKGIMDVKVTNITDSRTAYSIGDSECYGHSLEIAAKYYGVDSITIIALDET